MFYTTEMLIDCSNLEHGARNFGGTFDYSKLASSLPGNTRVRCFLVEDEYQATEHHTRDKFLSLGFEVVTKELKYYGHKASGNFDVEIALEMAAISNQTQKPHLVILGSGDGDFTAGVRLLQDRNVKVWGLAFERSMSYDLRQALDRFICVGREFVRVSKINHFSFKGGAKWLI